MSKTAYRLFRLIHSPDSMGDDSVPFMQRFLSILIISGNYYD